MVVPTEQRSRYVFLQWARDPDGPKIRKEDCTVGNRSANGLIWGHSLGDFFWLQRIPGVDVVTIWSRSMIKEYGERLGYEDGSEEDDWEPLPRRRRVWPVLKLPKDTISDQDLSIIDEGSEHDGNYEVLSDSDEMDEACADGCVAGGSVNGVKNSLPADPSTEEESTSDSENLNSATAEVDGVTPHAEAMDVDDGLVLKATEASSATHLNVTNHEEVSVKSLVELEQGMDVDPPVADAPATPSQDQSDDDPFSLKGIPKLEEFIPKEYFPDFLLVYDPRRVTLSDYHRRESESKNSEPQTQSSLTPRKYKRLYPQFPAEDSPSSSSDENTSRVASLYLPGKSSSEPRIGTGNHSAVWRASLRLPHPLTARSRNGHVTVAAKVAISKKGARELLDNEGKTYDTFPEHLMEEWCGYNLVTPLRHPVPVGAVVPKFYGYYVPVAEKEEIPEEEVKNHCSDVDDYDREVADDSPILLMEECGTGINPTKLSDDEKAECWSLLLRLHYEEFLQQSFYKRNILVQPGPLTLPPNKRSDKHPSFRIIDFGRAVRFSTDGTVSEDVLWRMQCIEREKAQGELLIHLFSLG